MTTIKMILAFVAVAFFLSTSAMATDKGEATPAAKFIEKLGNNALTSLTVKDLAPKERERRVRDLLRTNFDIQTIGRFAVGSYWRDATEAEKKEYISLFEDMIVKTYTQRFAEYSGQSFKVTSSAQEDAKNSTVSTQIIQKDGPAVAVDWRVRDKGSLKVVDVVVEGISMSFTQRSDFMSVIQRGDGKIEALLASLRERKAKK